MPVRSLYLVLSILLAMTINSYAALSGVLLPPKQGEHPRYLVVLLHGYGSNAQDLLPLADWVPSDSVVVSLQAPIDLGNGRYAWYRTTPERQKKDIQYAGEQVVTQIRELQRQLNISTNETILGGFSQGAVVSWQIALTNPQAIGKVAIFSGRLPPDRSGGEIKHGSFLPRVFVAHGVIDQRIPVQDAEHARSYAEQQGYRVSLHLYPQMRHEITEKELTDFSTWLKDH